MHQRLPPPAAAPPCRPSGSSDPQQTRHPSYPIRFIEHSRQTCHIDVHAYDARGHPEVAPGGLRDGVLRARNTPLAFKVTAGDSGAGHTWSKVRLTWSGGKQPTYTCLTVQSDLRSGKISGIR
ncbi:hypothetical protein [Streptomyces sp. NPDC056192]|uniref:hypothetical protein n=1 Tax=unclassified Streptomyces TaxID=2593676 RepID=UPI0035D60FCB